jgi:hypothetical protein
VWVFEKLENLKKEWDSTKKSTGKDYEALKKTRQKKVRDSTKKNTGKDYVHGLFVAQIFHFDANFSFLAFHFNVIINLDY